MFEAVLLQIGQNVHADPCPPGQLYDVTMFASESSLLVLLLNSSSLTKSKSQSFASVKKSSELCVCQINE